MRYTFLNSRFLPWAMVAAMALIVSAIYGQFLWNPIVFDDANFFDGLVHSEYLHSFFRFELRWLPYATFEWTRVFLGLDLIWYRLGNLALHVATAAMLFAFLCKLFEAVLAAKRAELPRQASSNPLPPLWFAFFGALIFALHPAAVYGAAYLIQRTILMATLFTLIMWYLFLQGVLRGSRWRLLASAAGYFVAVLSKEHAILAPAVALAMLFLLRTPSRQLFRQVWPVFLLYGLIGAFVLFQFKNRHVIGLAYEPRGMDMLSLLAARDPGFDPGLAYPLSILTQSFLFFKYLLVWSVPAPAWMSVDMFETFATRFWSWPHTLGLIGFVLYPVIAIRLLLQRGDKGLLGFALLCPWLMFAAELSTVRIQESFVLYRSYLWMPGVFCALPFLFRKTSAKRAALVLAALAIVMIPVTWDRLKTFSSPLLLWNDAMRLIEGKDSRPGVERIYHNRGLAFAKLGYPDEAIVDFNKALALNPRYLLVLNDRGATYLSIRKYQQALDDFDNAIEIEPKFARAYLGRALTYEALANTDAAQRDYKELCGLGSVYGCKKLKSAVSAK